MRKTLFVVSLFFCIPSAIITLILICTLIVDIPNLYHPLTVVVPMVYLVIWEVGMVLLPRTLHRYWKEKNCNKNWKQIGVLFIAFLVLNVATKPINRAIKNNHIGPTTHVETDGTLVSETLFACETDGYKEYQCKICDEYYTIETPATGHSFEESVMQAASCSEIGMVNKVCSYCGMSEEIQIDMLPHTYEFTTTKEATLTEEGIEIGTCSVCGATCEESITKLGYTSLNPGIVSVSEFVSDINSNIDSAKEEYNGKWIQITGEIKNFYTSAGMTAYYLYGDRGDSGLRIVCWCDGELTDGFILGQTRTFVGKVREVTTVNATEIGDCKLISE